MQNAFDFWVSENLVNFFRGKANILMAKIMNPSLVSWGLKDMTSAIVIGLDWKRLSVLVKWDLVVKNGYLEVFAWDAFVHDDASKLIDRVAGVKDIVYKENLIAST
jgi:hypothetical protein